MAEQRVVARALTQQRPRPVIHEAVLVGQQRVHPVDGDEVLGERVRDTVVIRCGRWNTYIGVSVDQPDAKLGDPVAGWAVPIRMQRRSAHGNQRHFPQIMPAEHPMRLGRLIQPKVKV